VSIPTYSEGGSCCIDWTQYREDAKPVLKAQKQLREHQTSALSSTVKGLATADRGKRTQAIVRNLPKLNIL